MSWTTLWVFAAVAVVLAVLVGRVFQWTTLMKLAEIRSVASMMEGKTMGWLWSGRSRSRTRPRVSSAGEAARVAYVSAQTTRGQMAPLLSLGSAMVATDQIGWAHTESRVDTRRTGARQPARREEFGEMGALIERAEQTARNLGRSRAEMWEEALRTWLETQGEEPRPAPRPWLFEARRQRVWGEIEQTLSTLRTA
jgi:hypothetical protein